MKYYYAPHPCSLLPEEWRKQWNALADNINMNGGKMVFEIKDSGKRQEFASGMIRDTTDGKINYLAALDGPMFDRWAEHLTKGKVKYPDVSPGRANWMLANGEAEYHRFRQSAFSHFRKWLRGDMDEDHAAALFFNVNGAEYVKEKLKEGTICGVQCDCHTEGEETI